MLREILPNIVAPIIVIGTVRVANAIILESTLSFLGLGVPITEPSLGALINEGYQVMFSGFWWISVFPGLALMGVVLGINLLGDRLRDVLNPRLKR
jgi:peptide/nickel transport system permease protein